MKCLTILQPWATLILSGAKRFETRSWSTAHRGLLGIHAGRTMRDDVAVLCTCEPFRSLLKEAGYRFGADLPRGVLLGTVELLDCVPVAALPGGLDALERSLGDYRPGRYAWKLANPRPFTRPIPWSGRPGVFEIETTLLPELVA
jgi:hypothetical protein